MTVYVIRDGRLVDKRLAQLDDAVNAAARELRDDIWPSFPMPRLSRIEPYESPVTGREITSWRERDRDMAASDSVDPRDFPRDHGFAKGRAAQLKETP